MVEAGPRDPFPRPRLDLAEPTLGGFIKWLGHIAVWFLPAVVYRMWQHLRALGRARTAGECSNCHVNLTWPIRGGRPGFCPSCGVLEPCPEPEPSAP